MDADEFWQVVERARAVAGPAADRARRDGQPDPVTKALTAELTQLSPEEIVQFALAFGDVRARANCWDLCAACWIIEYGFLSDDGFSDFRAGLVDFGRHTFDAAIADPDSLAGHPAVQEISRSSDRSLWIGDERMLYVATQAHEQRTGDPDAFWEEVAAAQAGTARPTSPQPAGERWDLRDEGEWRRRLPKLGAMFLPLRSAI